MQLPAGMQEAIEQELAHCDISQLRDSSARLSRVYRNEQGGPDWSKGGPPLPSVGKCEATGSAMATAADRTAYLAVRMPATFAAIGAALAWTQQACSHGEHTPPIRSLLDLGSGPGTALWAAAQQIPGLERCTAVERDPDLIELGRRLAEASGSAAVRGAQWVQSDLTEWGNPALPAQPQHANFGLVGRAEFPAGCWDLVVCSYALNEVSETRRGALIREAWERCAKLLVIVEPGTRAGFANILAVRDQLLGDGARLAAPCPHALACPMAASGDWCHFAARVERTALHRRLKDASLGHEDEKFSYVAFTRTPVSLPAARIVRHPQIFSGYAQLTLCREGELAQETVTRSQKQDWRRLKRLGWGDPW